jgi:LysM repeat protein
MHADDSNNGVRPRAGAALGGLLVGAAAAATLTVASAARFSAVLATHAGVWRVETAVEIGVCAAAVLVAAWLAASASVTALCVAVRLGGASWRAGERLVHRCAPGIVRKALVVAVAATVGLGVASGASAAPEPVPSATVAASVDDLGWVVTTPGEAVDAAVAPTHSPLAAAAPDTVSAPAERPVDTPVAATAPVATVVVAEGDSLWSIAARHLPPDASDAEIARAWPLWYRANETVVGADPDVIHPGQVLTVPATVAGAAR